MAIKKVIALFIALFSLLLISCEKWLIVTSTPYSSPPSRLLLYMHSTSFTPPHIVFTLSAIKLQAEDNHWINLTDGPIDISSTAMLDKQIFLKDAAVEPGLYKGLKLVVSKASLKGKGGEVNLALPEPDGEVVIKTAIRLMRGASFVASLAWNPEQSVAKGYLFQPSIEIEPQRPSAMGLLLFVSNSASNYISIIDRSMERVIGAVTVGERPMGMVFNSTQERLYVVNTASRNISIVDTTQFSVLDTIQLTAGIEPTDIAIVPDDKNSIEGKLYITNRISNDVTVASTTTRRVLKTIAVGVRPSAIAADAARREIYVTNELSNNVSIINAVDDSLVATVTVDSKPMGIVVGKDKVYIFNEGSNRISIISPSLRKVAATIAVEGPPRRGVQGFSGRLFVANTAANTLTFLNSQDIVTRTIPVGIRPIALAGDEKRNRLYITNQGDNTVSLLDPIGERMLKELYVGKGPYGVLLLER